MDIIFAIIFFVIFSVIADKIEGKKKRQQAEKKQTDKKEKVNSPKQPDIVIPPIKDAPSSENKTITTEKQVPIVVPRYVVQPRQETKIKEKDVSTVEKKDVLKQTDIHSDVLMNAVMYAQILQPPKAYQYIKTRSIKGDWVNYK